MSGLAHEQAALEHGEHRWQRRTSCAIDVVHSYELVRDKPAEEAARGPRAERSAYLRGTPERSFMKNKRIVRIVVGYFIRGLLLGCRSPSSRWPCTACSSGWTASFLRHTRPGLLLLLAIITLRRI